MIFNLKTLVCAAHVICLLLGTQERGLRRELGQWKGIVNDDGVHYVLYLIILFNLIIPTLLSLVGGTLSGNRCGSPNHI